MVIVSSQTKTNFLQTTRLNLINNPDSRLKNYCSFITKFIILIIYACFLSPNNFEDKKYSAKCLVMLAAAKLKQADSIAGQGEAKETPGAWCVIIMGTDSM